MLAASIIIWYIFGYLGLAVNFTIRWIRELHGGNACYKLPQWVEELRNNEMVLFAGAGSYTIIYSILQWIGFHGWVAPINTPLWGLLINQGIFAPSPLTAILAPICFAVFEWLVNRVKQKISEKANGIKFTDPISRTTDEHKP